MRYFIAMYFIFCAALLVIGVYLIDRDYTDPMGVIASILAIALVLIGMWKARNFSWEIKKIDLENEQFPINNN